MAQKCYKTEQIIGLLREALNAEGLSMAKIAAQLGVGRATAYRALSKSA